MEGAEGEGTLQHSCFHLGFKLDWVGTHIGRKLYIKREMDYSCCSCVVSELVYTVELLYSREVLTSGEDLCYKHILYLELSRVRDGRVGIYEEFYCVYTMFELPITNLLWQSEWKQLLLNSNGQLHHFLTPCPAISPPWLVEKSSGYFPAR